MNTDTNLLKNSPTTVADANGSLLDTILAEAKLKPRDEGYDVARRGVQAFITEMLAPNRAQERIDQALVDAMIAEVDRRLSAQVNEILHHATFQSMASRVGGLEYSIVRVAYR